ncbi:MAG: PQQ-dependent sugar dehydrogenase [Candidatus Binatia bacterium]
MQPAARVAVLVLVAAVVVIGGGAVAHASACDDLSAHYVASVISGARRCLTRLVPVGRSCVSRNRTLDGRAARVSAHCPRGTVARLACAARQAILAAGLPYDLLASTGFAHLCHTATCGNGSLEPGEQCDDGNVTNADGCSATCQLEARVCTDLCAGIVPVQGTAIKAELVASGLSQPLFVTAPSRDVSRLFVVEKTGTIRILQWGTLLPRPFLDIRSQVSSGSEQGLLGLAFHPDYASNGRFFVDYTDTSGNTVVAQYRVSADPDVAVPNASIILEVQQPFANHNGGDIAFGPDGFLYVGLGDGGSGGDPHRNAQNRDTFLGKLLRIDVDSAFPYTSPPTNPFAGSTPGLDAIWAFGLRNPWRFSFDRQNGDLYIADVGQNRFEEIDYQPGSSTGGENYGWNVVEGSGHCFRPPSGCDQAGLKLPILEYSHSEGCSVTGGYVYRGCKMPDLQGTYFYADFCTGFIRTFVVLRGAATNLQDRTAQLTPAGGPTIGSISSFGEDARGEIYICDLDDGEVFKIVPASE